MADKSSRYPLNIEGIFYVDNQCIACDACIVEAPTFFKMNDIDGHAYVIKQPHKVTEIELCTKALDLCPVGSIGNDG